MSRKVAKQAWSKLEPAYAAQRRMIVAVPAMMTRAEVINDFEADGHWIWALPTQMRVEVVDTEGSRRFAKRLGYTIVSS